MSLVLHLVNNGDVTADRNSAGQTSCVKRKLQVVSVNRTNTKDRRIIFKLALISET